MTQNNTRKEPTFGETTANNKDVTEKGVAPSLHTTQNPGHTFTPVLKQTEGGSSVSDKEATKPTGFTFSSTTDKAAEAEKSADDKAKSVAQETAKVALNTAERVVPTATTAQEKNGDKEASEMKKTNSSLKGKRLGLVALLAVILGGVFFWLKPSTPETVEELQQQQGGSLPIEFRPVDEAEAQKAEAEAKAQAELQAQQAQQQQAEAQAQAQRDALAELQAKSQAAQQANQEQQTQPTQTAQTPAQATEQQPAVEPTQPAQSAQIIVGSATQAPAATEIKSDETTSVIHQEEEKVAQPVRKVEKKRPTTQKVKAMTAEEFNAKKAQNAQMDKLVQSVSEGKSVAKSAAKSATKSTAKSTASSEAASSKTLTVPKGTSLMQVFRDNNLNIADVNAMSKVHKAASRLKANEKVTVRLDKNNRVVEMSIGSGGKYVRQANGSYSYK